MLAALRCPVVPSPSSLCGPVVRRSVARRGARSFRYSVVSSVCCCAGAAAAPWCGLCALFRRMLRCFVGLAGGDRGLRLFETALTIGCPGCVRGIPGADDPEPLRRLFQTARAAGFGRQNFPEAGGESGCGRPDPVPAARCARAAAPGAGGPQLAVASCALRRLRPDISEAPVPQPPSARRPRSTFRRLRRGARYGNSGRCTMHIFPRRRYGFSAKTFVSLRYPWKRILRIALGTFAAVGRRLFAPHPGNRNGRGRRTPTTHPLQHQCRQLPHRDGGSAKR